MQITAPSDEAGSSLDLQDFTFSLRNLYPRFSSHGLLQAGSNQAMNSLLEVVMWGAPAVLLSWGLLLALGCVLVFRDDPSPQEEPARSGVAEVRA